MNSYILVSSLLITCSMKRKVLILNMADKHFHNAINLPMALHLNQFNRLVAKLEQYQSLWTSAILSLLRLCISTI